MDPEDIPKDSQIKNPEYGYGGVGCHSMRLEERSMIGRTQKETRLEERATIRKANEKHWFSLTSTKAVRTILLG